MIKTIDVECNAANPNLPLKPMFAFVNSPSSIRVRNVPKRIGDWCIRKVYFTAVYPDSTVKTAECVLTGGVWVGTIEGTNTSGTSKNGYTIFADGTDENGNNVTGYVLGKGDIEILEADGTMSPDPARYYVKLLSAEAVEPREGDMYPTDDGYVIWQNGQAHLLGTPFEQISAYVESAISAKADLSAIPSNTSQLSNDSGYITSSDIHSDYIEDTDGNKINADRNIVEVDLTTPWTVHDQQPYTMDYNQQLSVWEYINEASNKTTLYYNSTDGQWIMEYFIWIDGGWMPAASNYATGTMYDQSIYFPETTLTVTRTTHFTGKLATQNWVLEQLSAIEARIAALEGN